MRLKKVSPGMPRLRAISVSALPSTVYETSPSTSSGSRPASPSVAWIASTASCISLRPESLENSVAPMPAMAVRFESQVGSTASPPKRSEQRQRQGPVDGDEPDFDRKSDAHLRGVDPDEVGHQAGALIELDERDDVARIEAGEPGLVRPAKAVDGSAAAGLHRVGRERATAGTHRARWMPQPPAFRTALDQELAATDAGSGSHLSGSRWRVSFRARRPADGTRRACRRCSRGSALPGSWIRLL